VGTGTVRITESDIPRAANPAQEPACHRLQLYTADGEFLVSNVGDYLCEGFGRGEGLLVITTPEHWAAFERKMKALISPADFARGLQTRQIVFLDAQNLLSQLIVAGELDWARFEFIMGGILARVQPRFPCRAYGEMVGLLWAAREFDAAIQLEEFWNRLLSSGGVQLFCAYPIDIFGAEFHNPAVEAVLRSHTHLMSSGDAAALHSAVNRAAGPALKARSGSLRADLPEGEARILWLHENVPADAGEILSKARQHYENEKRFRALIENSSDAIALTDPQGHILFASPSTAHVLGYRPEEIVGRRARDFVHPEDRENVWRTMQGVLNRPRVPLRFEMRIRRGTGGWCWIEATGSNLLDEPDISAIVFNCRDISGRKSAEMALRESQAALMHANASLEQFAYAAAHDLQEPIRNVAIYLELLERDYTNKLDAEANELIRVAREGALRMQTLTRDLLTFTRSLECIRSDGVSASALPASGCVAESDNVIAEVVANLKAGIQECGAEVIWESRPDARLPALPIYRAHLLQVLQNLVGNALKYRGDQPPRVFISIAMSVDDWLVSVSDNGVGVPAEYQEQIFGIFKRLHGRDIPGNGIGLAICSRIVAHYHGRIWVEPRPGGGSVFSFTLPRENTHERKSCAA
jgi:PAS domain S-box-containing protein